jgi:hypothetical protein
VNHKLLALYHKHVAVVYDRQMRLCDFLDENAPGENWGYNVPSASLTFGKAVRFEAPLLGSFAEGNTSWLWAWANRHLNLPSTNATLAGAVRGLGNQPDLRLFAADESFRCEEVLPEELMFAAAHVFGVIATGELSYDAYYTIPYAGGRGVALIRDARLRRAEPHPLLRISSIFPQAIGEYLILDHRAAFISYVESYGFQAVRGGRRVVVRSTTADVMTACFDKQDRLTKLESTIPPAG